MRISRRHLLAGAGAGALALAARGGRAFAAMGPNDKFDLLIKGGDVLDPSQSLRGRRDIGIRYGVIEAVEADIPAARARRCALTGLLLLPIVGHSEEAEHTRRRRTGTGASATCRIEQS